MPSFSSCEKDVLSSPAKKFRSVSRTLAQISIPSVISASSPASFLTPQTAAIARFSALEFHLAPVLPVIFPAERKAGETPLKIFRFCSASAGRLVPAAANWNSSPYSSSENSTESSAVLPAGRRIETDGVFFPVSRNPAAASAAAAAQVPVVYPQRSCLPSLNLYLFIRRHDLSRCPGPGQIDVSLIPASPERKLQISLFHAPPPDPPPPFPSAVHKYIRNKSTDPFFCV